MNGFTSFIITSQKAIIPGEVKPVSAAVVVNAGKINAVLREGEKAPTLPVIDCGNGVLMAGIVDSHAHINEPGRTDWEGFQTATRAAAAGGITSIIDMPLNSIPPTTTVANLDTKVAAAKNICAIDYGFWGGLIPGNENDLKGLGSNGVVGFKAFMCESGVAEFPMAGEKVLRQGMRILAGLKLPLIVHAELESHERHTLGPWRSYESYLQSRPSSFEVNAIKLMIRLMKETGCAVHIVHLSAAEALEDIARAKNEGLPLTVETCPHYLTFCSEEIAEGATQFKCTPPIRDRANREALWHALKSGVIDMVVSDHSPCTVALKRLEEKDFEKAWGGIAGLQFSLAATWTGMRERGFSLHQLSKSMSENPARLTGLERRKGLLKKGMDADLIIWDPDQESTPDIIYHKNKLTPYAGRNLYGVVKKTFVRGHLVYDGEQFSKTPWGERITR